ncbi:hypothetical protein CANCADRAFT_16164, partial [Tortispora caseinolytica NRRL Y-17796]
QPKKTYSAKCFRCNKTGHVKAECPNNLCLRCGQLGHLKTDCHQRVSAFACMKCRSNEHYESQCPK